MRGLTNDEFDALCGKKGLFGIFVFDPAPGEIDIYLRLAARDLVTYHVREAFGSTFDCFDITPLGELALRIHRALALAL